MKDRIFLFLKGVAMGAADVVPGVSGGTIAFISGIYEELLSSIKSVDLEAIKMLLSFRLKDFWEKINGKFLAVLFLGIGLSIVSLSRLVLFLLKNHPILIWSFFFGLIIASVLLVASQIKKWSAIAVVFLIIGTIVAYYISSISTIADEDSGMAYVFLCGAIAICAMILPGISGSFILILMGAYQLVFGSIKQLIDALIAVDTVEILANLKIIAAFGVGCLVGLISFSHLLTWLFKKYHDIIVATLIGFLLGSLNKVWPWKETVTTYFDRHGVEKPLGQVNVSPFSFEEITGNEAFLLGAIALAILGFFSVYSIELISKRKGNVEAA